MLRAGAGVHPKWMDHKESWLPDELLLLQELSDSSQTSSEGVPIQQHHLQLVGQPVSALQHRPHAQQQQQEPAQQQEEAGAQHLSWPPSQQHSRLQQHPDSTVTATQQQPVSSVVGPSQLLAQHTPAQSTAAVAAVPSAHPLEGADAGTTACWMPSKELLAAVRIAAQQVDVHMGPPRQLPAAVTTAAGEGPAPAQQSPQAPAQEPLQVPAQQAPQTASQQPQTASQQPLQAPAQQLLPAGPVHITSQGDFLGSLRYSLSQEPFPGAASMTLQDYVAYYSELCKDMALLLALVEKPAHLQDPSSSGGQHPLLQLQHLELQYSRLFCTVMLLHNDDLLNSMRIVNVATLELSTDPERAWNRTEQLVGQLELTKEQEATLVAGSMLFKRLIDRVREERQALSAQQGVQAEQRLATGRALDLEGQEVSAQRLSVLVKKERFLLTCASIFTAGVLTVLQNAQAAVLCWPYVPHLGLIGAILAAGGAT